MGEVVSSFWWKGRESLTVRQRCLHLQPLAPDKSQGWGGRDRAALSPSRVQHTLMAFPPPAPTPRPAEPSREGRRINSP